INWMQTSAGQSAARQQAQQAEAEEIMKLMCPGDALGAQRKALIEKLGGAPHVAQLFGQKGAIGFTVPEGTGEIFFSAPRDVTAVKAGELVKVAHELAKLAPQAALGLLAAAAAAPYSVADKKTLLLACAQVAQAMPARPPEHILSMLGKPIQAVLQAEHEEW